MTNRRSFLQTGLLLTATLLSSGIATFLHAADSTNDRPLLTFGMVTDAQYADIETSGSRHYRHSIAKLERAVDALDQADVDFIMHTGDLIDREMSSYDAILKPFGRTDAPTYFALGNHEFAVEKDQKAQVAQRLGMKTRYYDFTRPDCPGWRFVVLDGNNISTYPETGDPDRYATEQLGWLKGVLKQAEQADERVILFEHFPLLPVARANLPNAEALLKTIEQHKNVVAHFNGHLHGGSHQEKSGIHYVTFRGMVETPDQGAYSIIRIYKDRIEIEGHQGQKDLTLQLN